MKHLHELPMPTVRMKLAWYRGEDRMRGEHPDKWKKQRKGNHAAVAGAANARPSWRNHPDRMIALFTPKSRRGKP